MAIDLLNISEKQLENLIQGNYTEAINNIEEVNGRKEIRATSNDTFEVVDGKLYLGYSRRINLNDKQDFAREIKPYEFFLMTVLFNNINQGKE